jgi:hypothetical protein
VSLLSATADPGPLRGLGRARWLALGLAAGSGLGGCETEPRGPLDLDRIDEGAQDCVTVVHEALELGGALHRYVADRPGSPGGWALVTAQNQFDAPELTLVRVPAAADEPPSEAIGLGFASSPAIRVDVHAGATPGELWVLHDTGVYAALRRVRPGDGVIAANGSLANFPTFVPGPPCPTRFGRQLLLIEGRPYVLAVPDCSASSALQLQLLALDPETLVFANSWLLDFDPCASDPECGLAYTLGPIRRGEATPAANSERVAVGFSQVRDFGGGVTSSDVSLLELRFVAGTPLARLVSFRQVWLTPTQLDEVALAQDPFSIQLHVRNGGSTEDAALLRFDSIGELYIQVKTPQLLPLGGRGRLVQLATQSAMVDVRAGALEVVPLVDVASWPVWEPRRLLELDDLVSVEPAGVGQLLLRREFSPAQVIQLRCLE